VTCNYEARRRGLHKLQLVTEARRVCPNVVIRLGEDLDPFRAASKRLCNFLLECTWSRRAERLGFDEVWLDVTDMVAFNVPLVNHEDPTQSFFRLDRDDPSKGFVYDATNYAGHSYPSGFRPQGPSQELSDPLTASLQTVETQMVLGSHLARYLRHLLAEEMHFTATVGVSVNKTLSKLVGNLHKPDGQTTLAPPYFFGANHAQTFMDGHDIGKVPGIGFKTAQALRAAILGREATFDEGLVYGDTKELVSVHAVRTMAGMSAERMAQLLAGPGAPRDLGQRVWQLLHGVDETPVALARTIPTQISIEDSYLRLDSRDEMRRQLVKLTTRLVERLRHDLRAEDTVWLGRPQTLRLTTRARPLRGPDGTRQRSFKRVSKSGPMPRWVCAAESGEAAANVAERLVATTLTPLFKALHPDRHGLDLSLINVAATNMLDLASHGKARDIGGMFKAQAQLVRGEADHIEAGLASYVESERISRPEAELISHPEPPVSAWHTEAKGSEDIDIDMASSTQDTEPLDSWHETMDGFELPDHEQDQLACPLCAAAMPAFAVEAHLRWHEAVD
jgi:DNA polymerase iota